MKPQLRTWMKIIISGIFIFILTLSPLPTSALTDAEWSMFNANGVYYYDPNGNCLSPNGYTGTISGDNNEAKIWNYLVSANINGISNNPAAIAGILGNIQAESGFNPFAVSGSGTYYGLYKSNSSDMISAVNSLGDYWKSTDAPTEIVNQAIEIELDYLINDRFAAPEKRFAAYVNASLNDKIEDSSEGAKIYAELFMVAVERNVGGDQPLQSTEAKNLANQLGIGKYADDGWQGTNKRRDYAAEIYNRYAGSTPTTSIKPLSACRTTGNGIYTGDSVPQYMQCDPKWGKLMYGPDGINGKIGSNICTSGCGPTSFAMMATALLSKNILPDEVADIAGKNGQHAYSEESGWIGSSWTITQVLAKAYGLSYKNLGTCNIDTINEHLRDGWMIHTSGKGNKPFTKGGHYIGIAGLSNSGEWLIVDSADSNKLYSPESVVKAGMHCDNVKAIK